MSNTLDREVAEALGWVYNDHQLIYDDNEIIYKTPESRFFERYSPSTNWLQAGDLMLKYKISVEWFGGFGEWCAYLEGSDKTCYEATPQEAICRAIIEGHKK